MSIEDSEIEASLIKKWKETLPNNYFEQTESEGAI